MKKGFWYRVALSIVPALFLLLSRLLFATVRVETQRGDHLEACRSKPPFIAAFWHYGILFLIRHEVRGRWAAMVSASRDAEFVAAILHRMGYTTVRGSRGKGKKGLVALRNLIDLVNDGCSAAIVADGSLGPPRIAQSGVIMLAARSGAPILPVSWAADRYYSFRSWDRTALPKPFARVVLSYGEPIFVPAGIGTEEMEEYRLLLEERLEKLYRQVWGEFGREEH